MLTYNVKEMTMTCLQTIKHLFETVTVVLNDKGS